VSWTFSQDTRHSRLALAPFFLIGNFIRQSALRPPPPPAACGSSAGAPAVPGGGWRHGAPSGPALFTSCVLGAEMPCSRAGCRHPKCIQHRFQSVTTCVTCGSSLSLSLRVCVWCTLLVTTRPREPVQGNEEKQKKRITASARRAAGVSTAS
jgi:hypothetical protein